MVVVVVAPPVEHTLEEAVGHTQEVVVGTLPPARPAGHTQEVAQENTHVVGLDMPADTGEVHTVRRMPVLLLTVARTQ